MAAIEAVQTYREPAGADDSSDIVEQYARSWNLTPTETHRRLQSQITAGELIKVLRDRLPEEFSGGWVDTATGIVHIATTKKVPPQLASAIAGKMPFAGHLRLEVRPTSALEIEAAAQALRDKLPVLTAGSAMENLVAVSGQETTGGVIVEYSGEPSVTFEGRVREFTPVPVNFVASAPLVEDAVCLNPSECTDTPARGGVAINSPGGGCTVGFVVRKWSGAFKMVTNGHCMAGTDEVFFPSPWDPRLNGKKLGRFESKRYNGADIDVAVLDMVYEYESKARNGVFRYQTSPNYPMYRSGPGGVYEGANVCKTGRTTGYRCAPIYATNYNGSGAFASNQCGRFGDSGGPAFNLGNQALGLMARAGNAGFYGNGTCGSVEKSIFVYINYNTSLLSTSVFLG